MSKEQDFVREIRKLYAVINEIDTISAKLMDKDENKLNPKEQAQLKLLSHLQDIYYR